MNSIFYNLSFISLIFFLMQVSTHKYEFTSKSALITSNNASGYDHLWILNTSCYSCVIHISCHYLELYSYHSIIFTPSFHRISSDATFRNYSTCPFQFSAITNLQGFYFVYHYLFYFKSRDYFNFSYSVSNDKNIDFYKKELNYECFTFHLPQQCSVSNERQSAHATKLKISLSDDNYDIFSNRFMHASTNVRGSIYVYGGLSSKNISDVIFIRFTNNQWEIISVDSRSQRPSCLYGHSLTFHDRNNELILFGGSICGSNLVLNDIVWIFSIETSMWLLYKSYKMKPVMGHSSHIYQNIMYSFSGLTHSLTSKYTFLSSIQKFNITSREWIKEINLTSIGLMYHCSYNFGNRVWFFGGLYNTESKDVSVSNRLYDFDLLTEEWKVLSDNGPQLYLHECTVINDIYVVLGGFRIDYNYKSEEASSKWSQHLSQSMYTFNETSKKWSNTFINFTIFGHQISTFDTSSTLILLGGKSSNFQKKLIFESNGNCSIVRLQQTQCNIRLNQSHKSELIWTLLSSDYCHFQQCDTCVRHHCAWCVITNKCISKVLFASLYAIGGCEIPIFYESQCPIKCEHLTTSGCGNCTKLSFCGWCEFRKIAQHLSGVGQCTDGTINGPLRASNDSFVHKYCGAHTPLNNWYFIPSKCIHCNCNGHSVCSKNNQAVYSKENFYLKPHCSQCHHNTSGNECQYCENGFHGSAINGQMCTECKCVKDKYAVNCHTNGFCDEFCIENGRMGNYCEECDTQNNFTKFYDMCVFRIKTNVKYLFDGKKQNFNQYTNKIIFLLSDIISNMDLKFDIKCLNSKEAKIKVELFNDSGERQILLKDKYCDGLVTSFAKFLFKGLITYQLLFTVSGFQNSTESSFQLKMIFSQKTYINLPYIFISFFACLSASVLSFYTIYKLRQHINRRNRNYRTLMVMERPFAKVQLVDYSNKSNDEDHSNITQTSPLRKSCTFNVEACAYESNISNIPLLCVEPYRSNDTYKPTSSEEYRLSNNNAILSVLFLSPICKLSKSSRQSNILSDQYSPRILIGSTITKLTKIDKKLLLELPTKSSSGNNIMVDRDFDTSVSPSAAEELLTTEV